MQPRTPSPHTAAVIALDAIRDRRRYIALANANEDWMQVKASFALESIAFDDDDAERAGRQIAGVIMHEEAIEEIVRSHFNG